MHVTLTDTCMEADLSRLGLASCSSDSSDSPSVSSVNSGHESARFREVLTSLSESLSAVVMLINRILLTVFMNSITALTVCASDVCCVIDSTSSSSESARNANKNRKSIKLLRNRTKSLFNLNMNTKNKHSG